MIWLITNSVSAQTENNDLFGEGFFMDDWGKVETLDDVFLREDILNPYEGNSGGSMDQPVSVGDGLLILLGASVIYIAKTQRRSFYIRKIFYTFVHR
jgi:hypothetical protein